MREIAATSSTGGMAVWQLKKRMFIIRISWLLKEKFWYWFSFSDGILYSVKILYCPLQCQRKGQNKTRPSGSLYLTLWHEKIRIFTLHFDIPTFSYSGDVPERKKVNFEMSIKEIEKEWKVFKIRWEDSHSLRLMLALSLIFYRLQGFQYSVQSM